MSYTVDRSDPVIVQNRDALECLAGVSKAKGTIAFADQPHDGAVITISDGVTARAYTFVATATGAANEVHISHTDTAGTMTNFMTAVAVNSPAVTMIDPARGITVAAGADTVSCVLANTVMGTTGNVAITVTVHADHITATGMVGGSDGVGNAPLLDTWPKRVTTGASALLSASVTFPGGTFRLTLVPHTAEVVYMLKTTAANTSPIIPPGGISFITTKAVADALAVYSANANYLSVYVLQS